uniref:Uncharacterized protein n=1 Tax=Vitis vinifera TaxID=29760 RepID=A5C090_VITVI|nr:hypothetical protein VITISV_043967 [Vitis vinifera]
MALNLRASFKERQHKGLSESLPAAPPPVKRTRPEVSHEELVSDAHTINQAGCSSESHHKRGKGAKGEKKERKVAKAKARRIREEKEIAKAKCKDVEYKRDQLKELGKLRAVFEA